MKRYWYFIPAALAALVVGYVLVTTAQADRKDKVRHAYWCAHYSSSATCSDDYDDGRGR